MEGKATPVMFGGVLAIAALLLAPLGIKNPSPGRTGQGTGRIAASTSGVGSGSEALSWDDRGPWYALCKEFASSPDTPAPSTAPAEQIEETERIVRDDKGEHKYTVSKRNVGSLDKCVTGGFADFEFLIATVPDPVASHLDIEFDRSIESLQRAGSLWGYNFERYWLPWRREHAAAESSSSNVARSEQHWRQDQPGLLIFRKAASQGAQDQRLLIFLVGETPTAGLNRTAFANALKYIDQLTPPARAPEIFVAGPIFSATLPALGEGIDQYSAAHAPAKSTFHVVNYGARSDTLLSAFRDKLRSDPNQTSATTFSSLDLTVDQAQRELVSYLCELRYDDDQIAILAEDGSAYGAAVLRSGGTHSQGTSRDPKVGIPGDSTSSSCDPDNYQTSVLYLHFPRDLSAIRNAVEGDVSEPEPQQIGGITIPSTGVALTLRQEETNEHDTPPDFAQTQSSARVDRALRAMVKRLRSRRVQAVIVTATNPLDRVFLLEYLHLMVPDVRLATVGADDFMLGRPKFIDLSGTLAVTALPLLSENPISVWEKDEVGNIVEHKHYIDFPSNSAQGIFLASAMLLNPGPQLEGLADPAHCADVSIVGKTGFRVAVKKGTSRLYPCFEARYNYGAPSVAIGQRNLSGRQAIGSDNNAPAARRAIPFVWVIALTILLACSLLHLALVCSSNRWLKLNALPIAPRFVLSSSGVWRGQVFFLFVATGQVLLLEWIAVTTTLALRAQMLAYQWLLLAAHVLLLSGALLLCGWFAFRILAGPEHGKQPVSSTAPRSLPTTYVSVLVAVGFLVSTALFWWLMLEHGDPSPNASVARRTVYLLEGLSPALPVLFVLVAYYLWALNNLRRLTMVVRRVSLLIPDDNEPAKELRRKVLGLQCSISGNVETSPSALALLSATLLACFLVRLTTALRGFEYWFRGWLITWGFVLLLLILMAAFHRSWSVWIRMRKVLHFLDATALGAAFSQVPKELSSMRIWSAGGSRTSILVQVRTAELLEKMDQNYPMARVQAAVVGGSVVTAPISIRQAAPGQESTFCLLRETNDALENRGVVSRPLAEKLSAALNRRMLQTGFLFDPECRTVNGLAPGERSALELYVAHRFVAFFRYVMLQLRNMLTFVVYGYACLVVGMTVYPFQGRESLGTLMSVVFVLLLGGVAAMIVQMYSDPILKQLEEPSTGWAESFGIATKVIGVAGVPLLAVLASQFPSIAGVILNWIQPLVEASH